MSRRPLVSDDRTSAKLEVAPETDRCASASWANASASVTVVIATHNRSSYLADLFDALHRQAAPKGGFEVVIADDGSDDDTWAELRQLVALASLPVLALRLTASGGPSRPRNTAAAAARGALLVMTDDDCIPDPGWVQAHAVAAAAGVAQGMTVPTGDRSGTWDRSIEIRRFSGLYETCNLSLPRALFLRLGGFPVLAEAQRGARGFGEDVLLGVAAAREGGKQWVPAAVVRHRWIPGSFTEHLAGRRRLAGFPMLLREAPDLRELMYQQVFLTRRTAAFDTAALSVVTAATTRRLLPAVGSLPWIVLAVGEARRRPGRPVVWRMAQAAVADTVAAASLVRGSIRHRRLLL